MKIGIFTDSYLPSADGVATSVATTCRELQKLGHDVTIVAPNQPNVKAEPHIYRLASIKIVKSPEIWWALEVPQTALFQIASLDFDIIHGHSGGPISFLGWQLARLHNLPFVETHHTLWKFYRHYLMYPELVNNTLMKKITALAGNDCDAMIAPSVKAKNDLLSDGVRVPLYIVPNGIDTEKFINQPKNYLHQKFNIPQNKKILLTVGRLHKEKAIDFLIEAFAKAFQSQTDMVFVIIGKGKRLEEFQTLAKKLKVDHAVLFAGTIPFEDMPKAYADTDLFIFASLTESQGMVVTEAFATSVPVVAVQDAVFEGVIANGVNGFLTKKNTSEFAEKIISILTNDSLQTALGINAVASAKQFSIEETTRVLIQIYEEIIFNKTTELQKEGRKRLFFDKNSMHLLGLSHQLSKEFKVLRNFYEKGAL